MWLKLTINKVYAMEVNYIAINNTEIIDKIDRTDIDLNKSRETIFPSNSIINLKGGNNIKFITHKESGKIFFKKTSQKS